MIETNKPIRENMRYKWQGASTKESRQFTCGHCGNLIASNHGYSGQTPAGVAYIYICHKCGRPTFFDYEIGQVPGAVFGNSVEGIPDPLVAELYEEARRATGANCYTSAILCCRKLLMHIAVSLQADEGLSFAQYVTYLKDHGYTPPNSQEWIDHIRKVGNEANHEINIGKKEDAQELLTFLEMLLKFIFEFQARMQKKTK